MVRANLTSAQSDEAAPDVCGPWDVREVLSTTLARLTDESTDDAQVAIGVALVADWLGQQEITGLDEILAFLRCWPIYASHPTATRALVLVLRRIRADLITSVH